jgi:hypothetical protein
MYVFWKGSGSETGSVVYMKTYKIKKVYIGANTKRERVVIDKLPNLLMVLVY